MNRKAKALYSLTAAVTICLLIVLSVSAQTAVSDQQITEKVNEYMDAAVKVEGFSGSILVARNGKPIVSKGYGMANIELGVKNTPETVYLLGSVTKQFTGMAIAMLQERGKLSVDDPLCKFVDDCPKIWEPITVKHLLTHRSGIKNYTDLPNFAKTAMVPMTTSEMTEFLKPIPLDFVPDEKNSYSNSGYFMLGVVIEKASGKTYAGFLEDNIFTPLGMKNSGYDDPLRIIKNRASGYTRQAGKMNNAAYLDMSLPYAAGSLYSTTGDLLLWDQALYTEKLVSKKSLDEIFTPSKSGYGYGWGIGKRFEHRTISHGGGIFGFSTNITRFPDDNVVVVVLTNIQGSPAGRVSNDLAAIVFGAKYEIPKERVSVAVDRKILETYTGKYQIKEPNLLITISIEDGTLVGDLSGIAKFGLLAESESKFFSKDAPVTVTFNKDAEGKVSGLTFVQGGAVLPAAKIE
ncbi:MAG: serine hydrolase [Pyrinomonadaceae bacterium]